MRRDGIADTDSYYVSLGIIKCRWCEIVIQNKRDSLKSHLTSTSHKNTKKKKQSVSEEYEEGPKV